MIILGENAFYNPTYKSNANNLLIGAPGTGKTRSFVLPNLMNAKDESIIVLDPKCEIYSLTHNMMEQKGYRTHTLNFIDPQKSSLKYNPLHYCKNEDDILKLSELLVSDLRARCNDLFWPTSSQILCNALIAYLKSYRSPKDHTLNSILKLLRVATVIEDNPEAHQSRLDRVFKEVEAKDPSSWALSQYDLVKRAAGKTQKSIIISLIAEFCGILTPRIVELTSKNTIDLEEFTKHKTIIYVNCSDTDRSKDMLISLFFTQFFQELYQMADNEKSRSLTRPVHVILDDMGANLTIPNLDGIISTSRGRDISISIVLQSIGQLKKKYTDYTSIINSCTNVVFLGGSDIETCQEISLRLNKPLYDILYKSPETIYVFKQGEKPITTKVYDIKKDVSYSLLNDNRYNRDTDCTTERESFSREEGR